MITQKSHELVLKRLDKEYDIHLVAQVDEYRCIVEDNDGIWYTLTDYGCGYYAQRINSKEIQSMASYSGYSDKPTPCTLAYRIYMSIHRMPIDMGFSDDDNGDPVEIEEWDYDYNDVEDES